MGKRQEEEHEAELRLLRMDGRSPTMREKWTAFYRLWRITHRGKSADVDLALGYCLRTLYSDWSWIILLDGDRSDCLTDTSQIPKSLRRQFLKSAQYIRLYKGSWPRSCFDDDCKVSYRLREEGIEKTPRQVGEVRWNMVRVTREALESLGVIMDNAEILKTLKHALKGTSDA